MGKEEFKLLKSLQEKVLAGQNIDKGEALQLLEAPLEELCEAAD